MSANDRFSAVKPLKGDGGFSYFSLEGLEMAGFPGIGRLPVTIRIMLEAALRNYDGFSITEDHIRTIASWTPAQRGEQEIPFMPARVLLQDFTGVPAIADLAAMRSAMTRLGLNPSRINPLLPVDLVIDHSVQVDYFGTSKALDRNLDREYERNAERYTFIRWGQKALKNFRVVPPNSGICHQVNLEFLAGCVLGREVDGLRLALPDSLVGTDSHTTMINGLGVLGWGVGGIEAEAVMLGQPLYMTLPQVVGVKLTGRMGEGITATDLVLAVTQMLRKHGVVEKIVEFYGEGLDALSLPDRATLANMAPEYGATTGFFPVDGETLKYLTLTGRSREQVDLVERYTREQGLFRSAAETLYSESLTFDMSSVEACMAGPRRPQERILLSNARRAFITSLTDVYGKTAPPEVALAGGSDPTHWSTEGGKPAQPDAITGMRCDDTVCHLQVPVECGRMETFSLTHGAVVIAAITSCTNTSNPSVLMAAGLLAKKAVERGLAVRPWIKASLAPGSRAVSRYLAAAGLLPYLEALRFHVVGYGCTTCIGNSGTVLPAVADAIRKHDIVAASVLSGNRNFEGRVNPLVKANYLASPPLVVAYALAGTMNLDIVNDPIALDSNGDPVYLRDIWPSSDEIQQALGTIAPEMFRAEYDTVFDGDAHWKSVSAPTGDIYSWDGESTYIQEPSFFQSLSPEPPGVKAIAGARALALLGDSVTTDHISPAGSIPPDSPAGQYLISKGVTPKEFNSYGARRGNHEVMVRGTFANIRIRNKMAGGKEGGWTTYVPDGSLTSIYDAAMKYAEGGVPLIVLAGKEYGTGSSRDWAAKGTTLLGIKAVIAESYERIHRSNLVGMGVIPLQFKAGESAESLGLTGHEKFDIDLPARLTPRQDVRVTATGSDGAVKAFVVTARVDSVVDVKYVEHGGILQAVLREMMKEC